MLQRRFTLASSVMAAGILVSLLLWTTAAVSRADDRSSDIDLWVTPLGLSFGPVPVGEISSPQTVTLTNLGAQPLAGFTPASPTDPQFQITTTCDAGLAPGAQCTHVVRFAPTAAGYVSSNSRTETDVAIFEIVMNGEGVTPQLAYDARQLDLGALPIGAQSAPQSVIVRNVGRSPVTGFTNPAPSDDQFAGVHDCPATLAPGETCRYTFDFRPTRVGPAAAQVAPGNTARPLAIGLQAWASPALSVSPREVDFGRVISGTLSPAMTVTLRNLTAVPLTGITVTGSLAPSFLVEPACGDALEPGATCTLRVTMAPTTTGAFTTPVTLTADVQGVDVTEQITVTLRGAGCDDVDCPVAPLTVNPAGLDMGTAAMGTQSAAVPLTITNNSPYTATFTGSSVSDPQFLVTRSCGSTLPPGASCSGSVRFRPFRAGAAQATATTSVDLVDADAALVMTSTYTVAAQGFGIPGFMYSPRAVDLPPTPVGATSAPVTVTVRSLGGTLAGFSGINAPAPFTSTTDCDAGVPPFGLCHDVVRFTPLASSRYTVTRGVGTTLGLYELTISGQGQAAKLWATPTVLNFGTITAGTTSAPQHVAIVNVGYAPLAFDALPQPESDQYTLTSDCPELLAPDARCMLTYRFQPRTTGSDDTEAAIATNGGTRKLRLWGYAAAAPVDEGDRIFLPHVPTE